MRLNNQAFPLAYALKQMLFSVRSHGTYDDAKSFFGCLFMQFAFQPRHPFDFLNLILHISKYATQSDWFRNNLRIFCFFISLSFGAIRVHCWCGAYDSTIITRLCRYRHSAVLLFSYFSLISHPSDRIPPIYTDSNSLSFH